MAIEKTDHKEIETIRMWMERYKASESYCTDFFEAGRKNYNLYKSYQESDAKVYKHNIFVPYSFAYCEDMIAYFMLSIMASPVTFSFEPRMKAISLQLCNEIQQLVNWVLTEESVEFVLELEEIIKSVNIFNVGYLLNYPTVEQKRIVTGESDWPVAGMEGWSVKNVFSRYHLNAPHPHDIYPEPQAKRLSRANWVIKAASENFSNLKKIEAKGGYIPGKLDMARGYTRQSPVGEMLSGIGLGSGGDWAFNTKTNKIEILDCMSGSDVITIAGRSAIIQDTTKENIKPSSFDFPLLDCRTTGGLGEFFGMGVIEQIKPTQLEMNLLRSQRRDNISLILNKVFTYDISIGEIDWASLISAPGNIIIGKNIKECLSELEYSDVTGSAFKESEDLKYDMQNISAMWDYARGGTPRRRETATGIIRLQQAAQSRNEWQLRKIDAYILQPLAKRIVVALREYLPREDYEAIIGKDQVLPNGQVVKWNRADEFYGLDLDQLKRMLQVQPLTESIVSIKEVELNAMLQAFDRLVQLPEVNRTALIKQLLYRLGNKDVNSILPQLSGGGQEGLSVGLKELAGQKGLPGMKPDVVPTI